MKKSFITRPCLFSEYLYIYFILMSFWSKVKSLRSFLETWRIIQRMPKKLAKSLNTWMLAVTCLREAYWDTRRLLMKRAVFCKICQLDTSSLLAGLTMPWKKVCTTTCTCLVGFSEYIKCLEDFKNFFSLKKIFLQSFSLILERYTQSVKDVV